MRRLRIFVSCRYPFLVLSTIAAVGLSSCATNHCASTPTGQSPPAPEILQSGDLIWPKPPNAFVPYVAGFNQGSTGQQAEWERQKGLYLTKLRSKPYLSSVERDRLNALNQMSYPDFARQYFSPLPRTPLTTRGLGILFVGHVGIIKIENKGPMVVEAMIDKGVQEVAYKDWITSRPGQLFWLSRLKNASADERAAVAAKAASYLGKPYDFWNFNLEDDTGFYCSKLAWLAIYKVTGVAPDDDRSADRVLWYSPKQLLNSRHLECVVSSGDYGFPEQR